MSNVWVKCGKVVDLPGPSTTAFTADGTGTWQYKDSPDASIQATATGTGSIAATVTLQCSNDGVNAIATSLGVITLSGTTSASDGFITQNAPWKYIRAVVSSASGTGLSVAVKMGI
jgi:hypothetical protein